MIFYFSGTGNSYYAAKNIAQFHNEELISISKVLNSGNQHIEYTLKEKENIGFVFPIYAWGPPKQILNFISRLNLSNYNQNYVFSVVTCGSNIGNTMKVLDNCLKKKGLHLNSGYSVAMPNNYIIMGDVDSEEIIKEKLSKAEESLQQINLSIIKSNNEFHIEKGRLSWLLTGIINPMFSKNSFNTTKFFATDNCTGCGICEQVCNCNNIKVNKKPQWGKQCSQCLACVHYCPVRAVQYGKITESKGRYTNPNINIKDIIG